MVASKLACWKASKVVVIQADRIAPVDQMVPTAAVYCSRMSNILNHFWLSRKMSCRILVQDGYLYLTLQSVASYCTKRTAMSAACNSHSMA